ncbi:hypothetical protein ACFQY3_04245 [Paenibacillus farraposensis]|uniref:hypothetical protein n=1 Tax=Paenibacillus farraposensis TaxID=2807095 RepID=UPI003605C7FE
MGVFSVNIQWCLCNLADNLTYFKSALLCKQCILDLKGNVGVSPIPVAKGPTHKENKGIRSSSQQMVESLQKLMREHPKAKQGEYAEWLGVSQDRISQLKKLL